MKWPGAQAGHVKRCNALVSSVILRRTQQEVRNFKKFIFNSSNGPGQKPGMLSDVMQEVKNFNNFNFNSLNGLGHKPGMLSNVMHLSAR